MQSNEYTVPHMPHSRHQAGYNGRPPISSQQRRLEDNAIARYIEHHGVTRCHSEPSNDNERPFKDRPFREDEKGETAPGDRPSIDEMGEALEAEKPSHPWVQTPYDT
jgi:hypothetical protein